MNFCRRKLTSRICGASFILLPLIIFSAVGSIFALDPNRAISQFKREKWGIEEGFSGGTVYAFAQTPDGYLWIGCDKGLVRFDGINFETIQQRVLTQLLSEPVLGLLTDADGNLWVRLGRSAVLRYRDGKFTTVINDSHQPIANVTAINRTGEGDILISTLQGELLAHRRDEIFTPFTAAKIPKPIVNSMVKTVSGDVWLGTRDSGLFRVRGDEVSAFTANLPDLKINCLLPDGERGLWVGTDKGLVRWNGEQLSEAGVPRVLADVQILTMRKDSDQNIWLGTDKLGLVRMNANGAVAPENPAALSVAEAATTTTLFEDREGNLWIGGAQGIERLRDSAFATFSTAENLPTDKNGAIFVDTENRVWCAPLAGGLFWFRGNKVEKITADGLADDIVYSIAGDRTDLWIGRQHGGLTNLHFNGASYTAKTYAMRDGLAQMSIYAVHQNRDGGVWSGTLSGGASFYKDGIFTTYTVANGLASNTITAITQTADGVTWFATPTGLSRFSNENWQTLSAKDGLPSESIISLLADSSGILWIGTAKGLAFIDSSGRLRRASADSILTNESILGIAADESGGLWISTPNRIVGIERNKLLTGQISSADLREYNLSDGLKSSEGIKRNQTVISDAAGRIWFSTTRGISMVDTKRLKRAAPPAIVQINAIAVDGTDVELTSDLNLPAARRRMVFNYSGLSLTMPERVKFRYFLEGFDRDWSEEGSSHEAVYTNLSPGEYTFRVVASNSDGVWNSNEAAIHLTIKPDYWQTWWFRLLCGAAALLGVIGLYRLRLRGITGALNRQYEERLAERTRIAQELHDSLLQGVVSAAMQLNVAVDNLPEDSAAKPKFNRIISLMGEVTREGRNTLRGLRARDGENSQNLAESFAALEKNFARSEKFDFRIRIEGEPRVLRPVVRDEVYSIGREALSNANRHSAAAKVEIVIEYGVKHLRLVVRDDGCGINQEIVRNGRAGHWGIIGMRERAKKIGAQLTVRSRNDAGTEIELFVPQRVAYEKTETGRWLFGWFPRLPIHRPRPSPKEQKQSND